MKFILYKVSGYEEAIMALRMSKGKYYSEEKALQIQQLVSVVTNDQGLLANPAQYYNATGNGARYKGNPKITGFYEEDVAEFKRLLGLTMNNAMGEFKHHTLMKYIDISFFTDGLHRGAQDDLDSHAIAFNNRITRFSTRLAEIDDIELSEWYNDKVLTFGQYDELANKYSMIEGVDRSLYPTMPDQVEYQGNTYKKTPFGYVIEKFAQIPAKNGLAKDVQRGLMPIGLESNAIWKTDMANMRYVYKMRSKLTKANPELKDGMEQLADQLEQIPVFGEVFRKELTDSGEWEHMNKVRTISSAEFQEFKKWKKENKHD